MRSISESSLLELVDTVFKESLNIDTSTITVVYNDVLFERDPNISDEDELEMFERRLKKKLSDFKIRHLSNIFVEAKFRGDDDQTQKVVI
jgi:hypothetical protein